MEGGTLPARLKDTPLSERTIGSSLGEANRAQAVRAGLIGTCAVVAIMLGYYWLAGAIANVAMLLNVMLVLAALAMLNARITLDGIAGIILSIGMSVDANVLIYERIREEIRNGVTPQTAISKGFEKAFSSIADSNVTTLIAGIVLWIFGTGAIRGFAVVLSLGIITSMFTALLGSRALLTLMYGGDRRPARLSI
jgi:preprotein translocase subunit SecD